MYKRQEMLFGSRGLSKQQNALKERSSTVACYGRRISGRRFSASFPEGEKRRLRSQATLQRQGKLCCVSPIFLYYYVASERGKGMNFIFQSL